MQHVDAAVAGAHRDSSSTGSRCGIGRSGGCSRRRGGHRLGSQVRGCTAVSAWISVGVPRRDDAAEVEHVDVHARAPSRTACRARRGGSRARRRRARRSSRPSASVSSSSSPEDGSSSSSTFGLVASARASSTSRAVPVGSASTDLVGDGDDPDLLEQLVCTSSAGGVDSSAQRRRISAATSTFSRAERLPNASSRWNVRAMPRRARRCGFAPVRSTAVEHHAAAVGRLQPGDHVEQRRLAGAVRADEAGDAAGLDVSDAASSASSPPNRTVMSVASRSATVTALRSRCNRCAWRSLVTPSSRSITSTSASVNGRVSPSSPTPGSAGAGLVGRVAFLRVLPPRQQRRERLADRADRARRVLDDSERGEARAEELQRPPQREVPVVLDEDEAEPEEPANSAPATDADPADHECEDDREALQHREARAS